MGTSADRVPFSEEDAKQNSDRHDRLEMSHYVNSCTRSEVLVT